MFSERIIFQLKVFGSSKRNAMLLFLFAHKLGFSAAAIANVKVYLWTPQNC